MPSLPLHFATVLSRTFERGRFLIIGADADTVGKQFAQTGRDAVVSESYTAFASKRSQDAAEAHFEVAVWFYPSNSSNDDDVAEELSRHAEEVVLVPAPGADITQRRPQLTESFRRLGLLPEYAHDLSEIDPGAIVLRRQPAVTTEQAVSSVEIAFARLNARLSWLQQNLQTSASELQAADRHIGALEEKLLKLKEYRRELKRLKEQRQLLRKSPERRIGQVLLAPYRLPEKLLKAAWKRLRRRTNLSRERADFSLGK